MFMLFGDLEGIPYGSKDPNNRVLGPKYYIINSIWDLKPFYLGPWTLRYSLGLLRRPGS